MVKATSRDKHEFDDAIYSAGADQQEAKIDRSGGAEAAVEAGIHAAGWRYAATKNRPRGPPWPVNGVEW